MHSTPLQSLKFLGFQGFTFGTMVEVRYYVVLSFFNVTLNSDAAVHCIAVSGDNKPPAGAVKKFIDIVEF